MEKLGWGISIFIASTRAVNPPKEPPTPQTPWGMPVSPTAMPQRLGMPKHPPTALGGMAANPSSQRGGLAGEDWRS